MKKTLLTALCFASIFACKKEKPEPIQPAASVDTVAPVITLNGKQQDTVLVLNLYTDPGATAADDKDGNISSSIVVSGTVSSAIPGTVNTLTYNVTDQAGNHASPVVRTVYVKPGTAYIPPGFYMVASASTTQNPGVDPILTNNTTYTSAVQLSGQTMTVLTITALNVGPVTGPMYPFGVNGFTFSLPTNPVFLNGAGLTYAFCTGTVSPSKTTFTIDSKYNDTMTPNKFYEVRNVFTKQ